MFSTVCEDSACGYHFAAIVSASFEERGEPENDSINAEPISSKSKETPHRM